MRRIYIYRILTIIVEDVSNHDKTGYHAQSIYFIPSVIEGTYFR